MPRVPGSRLALVLLLLLLGVASCGEDRAASPGTIRNRVLSLGESGKMRGVRLFYPDTLQRFYFDRRYAPVWRTRKDAERVVAAIRSVAKDGLQPSDYHLEAIQPLLGRKAEFSPKALAELEVLLTDAVAAMTDHVRYGRVRPASLDPRWNVNPREKARPLHEVLAEVVRAPSLVDAIEKGRPDHFIYRGLIEALAQLDAIAEAGGWPSVPAGKVIKPKDSNPRVAAVRARLAVTGEAKRAGAADSTRYDPQLVEAVQLFQKRHRLEPDGVVDKTTVEAMNVPVQTRIAQVRVNLERARWVLGGLRDDFLLVNLPAFKAYLIRGGKNEWEGRTQVGAEARQTPTFRADMKTIVFNPDWTVPPTILEKDVLAGMRKGEDMIARKNLTILDADNERVDPSSIDWDEVTPEKFPYTLRQPPGSDNALGRVKFLFPNPHSIYLHDTPSRELFEAERRTFSSGCIRVERPLELAERLLKGTNWRSEKIHRVVDSGKTEYVKLENPLPVLIVYWTVSVGASGEVRYMHDVYGLDGKLRAALDGSAGGRVSQNASATR